MIFILPQFCINRNTTVVSHENLPHRNVAAVNDDIPQVVPPSDGRSLLRGVGLGLGRWGRSIALVVRRPGLLPNQVKLLLHSGAPVA